MNMNSFRLSAILATCWAFFLPTAAFAYIGPGAGLGAIAVTLAIVIGVLLLLVGLVWYPLKRLIKGKKRGDKEQVEATEPE